MKEYRLNPNTFTGRMIMTLNIGNVVRACSRQELSWSLIPGKSPVMEIQGYGEVTFQPEHPLVLFRPTKGSDRAQVETTTMRIIEELKEL